LANPNMYALNTAEYLFTQYRLHIHNSVYVSIILHSFNRQLPRQPGQAGTKMPNHPGCCYSKKRLTTRTFETSTASSSNESSLSEYQSTVSYRPDALPATQPKH